MTLTEMIQKKYVCRIVKGTYKIRVEFYRSNDSVDYCAYIFFTNFRVRCFEYVNYQFYIETSEIIYKSNDLQEYFKLFKKIYGL